MTITEIVVLAIAIPIAGFIGGIIGSSATYWLHDRLTRGP